MNHDLMLVIVLVATLGIAAQWVAWRLRLPAIVLLLAVGLLAGPGFGLVKPSRDFGPLLSPIIRLCVAVILFEGGLTLKIWEFRKAAVGVRRLVFPGFLVSFVLGTLAAKFIGGLTWPVATEFGAIVLVTGPTVIIPLLRHARLRRRPSSYLKWEGIVNDPIGALLAVLVFGYLSHSGPGGPVTGILLGVLITLATAAVLGGGGGWLLARAIRSGQVPEYLKGPVLLGGALAVYAVADLLQEEAGLAAVTVLGIVIGNQRLPSIEELRRFKEYVVVLLVSIVFILLTSDLDRKLLLDLLSPRGILLVLSLLFIVRPASVFLSTIGAGVEWRERLLVGWIAPRGVVAAAVAAAFAGPLANAGYDGADRLLPLVFALVMITVTIHGLTIRPLARRLDLAAKNPNGILIVGANRWSVELVRTLKSLEVPVLLADASWQASRQARHAGLPVHYGEILSEASEESLELNQIGTLLAATSNDAYNALVCTRFAPEFGRDRIFQLPMRAAVEKDPKGLAPTIRGRVAFSEDADYERLLGRHYRGWQFAKTRLTETFGPEEFWQRIGKDALPLLIVRESGAVKIIVPSEDPGPEIGDTVVSYQLERPPEPSGAAN